MLLIGKLSEAGKSGWFGGLMDDGLMDLGNAYAGEFGDGAAGHRPARGEW
jgi:hypothetical protein